MKFLLTLVALCISFSLYSQDELLLLNGKTFRGNVIDTTGIKILFDIEKKANKFKQKAIYRDEVFSIVTNESIEKVFFYPSLYYVDDYSVANMRYVVNGRKDGRNAFKTKWVLPVGLGFGALSAFLMKGSVFVFLVPVVYTGVVQIPIVKIQKESISNEHFIGNEFYKEGYNRSARSKRTKHALISSIAGVIAGALIFELTD